MEGSPLRNAFKALIQQVQQEISDAANDDPETGFVTQVNFDGTVSVQTSSNTYASVGNPKPDITVGTQVVVITADGTKIAIPQIPFSQ